MPISRISRITYLRATWAVSDSLSESDPSDELPDDEDDEPSDISTTSVFESYKKRKGVKQLIQRKPKPICSYVFFFRMHLKSQNLEKQIVKHS